ncbi:MAG: MerR family transcriptional regulator, partial [Hungatella sp.]
MKDTSYYTSGEFAKKANVTIRTIRYYDKQGILKPSRMNESGYRLYTDEDFGRLQKILSLKYLGFSLEEIVSMTINDEVANIAHSLKMQKELIQKKIRHLTTMEQTLE